MKTEAAPEVAEPADPPIVHHYVVVLVVEAALLFFLSWLEVHFS